MPKPRIALIGLGDIARKAYLPILATHPDVRPILCTRDPATLEALAARYRITETYRDVSEVIAARPDAAMVHSATDSHYAIVKALLTAGIPTFVDKPLTYSLARIEELITLARNQQTLLYLGFNRRFAPLVAALKQHPGPLRVDWQKHRVDLPDAARTFIFDDFIHVIDGLRFLVPGPVEDLRVWSHLQDGKLAAIAVRWTSRGTLVSGEMNRVNGTTEENITYHTPGNKWTVADLHGGSHHANGNYQPLGFGNWETTLHKRGFEGMIADWLQQLEHGTALETQLQDIRETHALAESILSAIEK